MGCKLRLGLSGTTAGQGNEPGSSALASCVWDRWEEWPLKEPLWC